MAVRAVRWLQSPVPPPGSFGVSAARYALEGSWTDVVWRTLWAGDTDPTLKTALAVLTGRVADRQRAEYRQFAQTLPGDDPSGRHPMHATDGKTRVIELVPVERVLAQVVAPLARVERVLVIVLDGYSIPVHQQVLPGLASEGWSAIAPDSVQMQVGVAMLPTVTDVSRASLLSGMATTGGPDSEDRGFAAALASLQPSAKLFHHGALAGTAGEAVAAVVAIAIASDDRVVGLVLNTVDDTLAKGTFPLSWSLAQLPKLADVLRLADEAGRIIVLTADHGHLVQQDMVMRAPTETGGERWRPASGAPAGVDEVTVRGPRVLRGDGAVALPWGDDVRYAPKKGGYHGGASPAEVLVPLVVLTRDVLPVGFGVASTEPPPWWNGASPAAPSIAPAVTTSSRRRPSQEQLFEVESRGSVADDAVPAWVSALLDSSLWKTRSAGRRQILDRPKLELLFAEFARRGGVLSFAAISELTEVLAGRVQGLVATLAPQCNIDGFAILTSDPVAAEARLDVAQLQAQFGARTTGR